METDKAKTFRIIKHSTGYSKKKGSYTKRSIVAIGISSYEEAVILIKKWHPKAVINGNIATNVGGLLYPTKYEIKYS